MYSYEDRIRAVRLYFKLRRRMAATLRQLGYSTKNSLAAWCAEFEQNQDLRRSYELKKWRYDDEQKYRAVTHYLEHGRCLAYTVRPLGYAPSSPTSFVAITVATVTGAFTAHCVGRACASRRKGGTTTHGRTRPGGGAGVSPPMPATLAPLSET